MALARTASNASKADISSDLACEPVRDGRQQIFLAVLEHRDLRATVGQAALLLAVLPGIDDRLDDRLRRGALHHAWWAVSDHLVPQRGPRICPGPVAGRCGTGLHWGRASRAATMTMRPA
jgi:hypothetical protein